jgi:phosphoglycolate phosphatase-like HAD superfamily hydrolase
VHEQADARGLVVFDIDGVLADVSHRVHHVERRPKNWAAFFAAAHADPPLAEGIALAQEVAAEHPLLYLTGRPESLRQVTERWLDRHDLPTGRLLMRRAGDFRPARVLKLDVVRSLHARETVHAVVDDDPSVVSVLQGAGFAVLAATWAATSGPAQQTLWDAQETDGRT